jgi:TusA-related sulfurtransferase
MKPEVLGMELDVRGEICPYPMMKTVEVLRRLPEGEVLEVLTDHPPALESIPFYTSRLGYRCAIEECGPGQWRIRITRAGVPTGEAQAAGTPTREARGVEARP